MDLNNNGKELNTIASMFLNGQLPDFRSAPLQISFKDLKPITSTNKLPTVASLLPNHKLPNFKFNSYSPIIQATASPTKESLKAVRQATTGNKMGISQGLQNGLNLASNFLDSIVPDNLDASQKAIKSSLKSATALAGPIGGMVNVADSVLGGIGALSGLQLDNMDKVAASRAGVKGVGINNTFMSIPVLGTIGGFLAGKTHAAYKSAEIDDMRSAYGGSTGDIDAAQSLGNKRFLFGKRKANKFIDKANYYNDVITGISSENKLRKQNTYGTDLASQNYMRLQGLDQNRMQVGKNGMKIPELEKAREILLKFSQELPIYKDGGKLNIIVEGSLHARKNNLENINSDLKGYITKKGIPVISYSDGGDIIQHAEIEGGELILNKDLTIQLEELYKKGTEEAMIEAGKLLAIALIKDTEDKTKVIL